MLQFFRITICPSCFNLGVKLLLFLKEVWINFQYVLVEVVGPEAGHGYVQIGLHNGGDVTLIHTEVESLDIVIMGHDAVDFGLDEDVRNDCRQVVCGDLFVQVE